jgi:pimeloyl-ACP methyl ester carboxylesterase
VLAVSPPGWETPPLPRDEYLPKRLAARTLALLDALGLDRAAYVGFSWGASIGCHLAAIAPERLTALVLLDAGYTDFQDQSDFRARTFDETVASIREYGGNVAPEVIAAAGIGVVEERPSSTLDRLGSLDVPILLIAAGETLAEDWARRALARFRSAVPAAEVHKLDSGHDLLAGRTHESIDLVGSWLERA